MPAVGDTIFALSTPTGRGAISIIRISGPSCADIIKSLTKRVLVPRQATLCGLHAQGADEIIDRALVLWFPGPQSFTGEDMAEFHIHGSLAVASRLIEIIGNNPNARLAGAGEFTRRAFENGRLDLAQAEGIADLIEAESESQRRQALLQMGGYAAKATADWRDHLARCLAHVEALIDFADDGVPETVFDKARRTALTLSEEIEATLSDSQRGELIRDGIRVAIIGPPNSGKSSLINVLAGQDVAIVSDTPGTTRDIIEVRLRLGGNIVNFADTAGIRETADVIEKQGILRAERYRAAAHVELLVLDITRPEEVQAFLSSRSAKTIVVWNKSDLAMADADDDLGCRISALTGEGVPELLSLLTAQAETITAGPPALITRARHKAALTDAVSALQRVFHVKHDTPELLAEDLRLALRHIGSITGMVGVEDLLDLVFKDFCIGK